MDVEAVVQSDASSTDEVQLERASRATWRLAETLAPLDPTVAAAAPDAPTVAAAALTCVKRALAALPTDHLHPVFPGGDAPGPGGDAFPGLDGDPGIRRTVDAVADDLGDEVAMVLLNSRLDGLAARPGAVGGVCEAFSPAFALSPPPEPAGGGGGDLVASYEHPGPWAIGKPKLLGGCDVLWRGDDAPTAADAAAALAAVDDPLAAAKQLFGR